MRARPSMSSSAARSSTAWIVAFKRPSSTTGQAFLMKRASDVPPLVDKFGRRPVTSSTAAATRSVNGPGFVKEAAAAGRARYDLAFDPTSAVAFSTKRGPFTDLVAGRVEGKVVS